MRNWVPGSSLFGFEFLETVPPPQWSSPQGPDVGGRDEQTGWGRQHSMRPDDTQARQFLTHSHPPEDSTHHQCPHPGLRPAAHGSLWRPLPLRTRKPQREEGAVGPTQG